jgi:hypothetical protein
MNVILMERVALLRNALALRGLAWQEKGLDQLTLSAARHAGEPLVPLTVWHFGFRVEPLREQLELRCGNLAPLDAIEEMVEQCGRKVLTANLRHGRLKCRRSRA